MELSSEVPGTNANWPSDISVWINDVMVSTWTSPGRFRRQTRHLHAALVEARRLAVRHLKTWRITRGSFWERRSVRRDPRELHLEEHHSIRLRIGVDEHAEHPGGVNIFGRGFGNYDQDILLRLHLK